MRKLSGRRAALLAAVVGVVGAVSGTARAAAPTSTTVYFQGNLVDGGAEPHFVALVNADLHRPPIVMFTWGSTLAKGAAPGSFDLPTTTAFDQFAVFGRDSAGGVFVTFSNGSASFGQSFANLFPGISEQQLADALLVTPDSQVVTSFAALLAQTPGAITPMGSTAQVTHFSSGADYGTFQASFTPVPEPASLMLIAGSAGLLLRRRARALV